MKRKKLVTPEVTSRTVKIRVEFSSSERYHSIVVEFDTPYRIGKEGSDFWTVSIKGSANRKAARKLNHRVDSFERDEHKFFAIMESDPEYGRRHRERSRRFATYEEAHAFAERLATQVLTYRARQEDLDEELIEEMTR